MYVYAYMYFLEKRNEDCPVLLYNNVARFVLSNKLRSMLS